MNEQVKSRQLALKHQYTETVIQQQNFFKLQIYQCKKIGQYLFGLMAAPLFTLCLVAGISKQDIFPHSKVFSTWVWLQVKRPLCPWVSWRLMQASDQVRGLATRKHCEAGCWSEEGSQGISPRSALGSTCVFICSSVVPPALARCLSPRGQVAVPSPLSVPVGGGHQLLLL